MKRMLEISLAIKTKSDCSLAHNLLHFNFIYFGILF